MTAPELTAYHLGIVVRQLESAMDAYRRMLGITEWRLRDPMPNGGLIAFGMGGGITFELLQVPESGNNQLSQFLREHGEGVQHVAFWTEDLQTSVENALAEGAKLVSSVTDASGNASVQLIPASGNPEYSNLDRVLRGRRRRRRSHRVCREGGGAVHTRLAKRRLRQDRFRCLTGRLDKHLELHELVPRRL
jgi:catechol 2,3-dioxygenase-like lactoylglutathione lyase family enzyme